MADRRRSVLVRHARPVIDADQSATSWPMCASATIDVERLAVSLRGHGCDIVVTSEEVKARETGLVIARVLDIPVMTAAELGEQGAGTIPWVEDERAFHARVVEHFTRSDQRIFGDESSVEAAMRFAGCVSRWTSEYRCPVLVSHGRVMSAYLALITDTDAIDFWEHLRMPDAFVVEPDARRWWRVGMEECAWRRRHG